VLRDLDRCERDRKQRELAPHHPGQNEIGRVRDGRRARPAQAAEPNDGQAQPPHRGGYAGIDCSMLLNFFQSVAGQISECARPWVRIRVETLAAVSMSGASNTST
jgi:hypothetical protein